MAWLKGKSHWWAYDVDLPPHITSIDVVLTASASAGARLVGRSPFWRQAPREIWDGGLTLSAQPISTMRISMSAYIPTPQAALGEGLDRLYGNSPVVQRARDGAEPSAVIQELREQVRAAPKDPQPLYNLSCMELGERDLPGAFEHLLLVNSLGPADALVIHVQQNLRYICCQWTALAKRDDAAAMYGLGRAYENGWGVGASLNEAKRWYRNAANAGHPEAMCCLASLYDRRAGATQDTQEARRWYREETLRWYRKSAELGNSRAKQWLAEHDGH
jgi:hypothetical protein